MSSTPKRRVIVVAAILAAFTTIFVVLTNRYFPKNAGASQSRDYALELLQSWSIPKRPQVVMHVDNSAHYTINTDEGAEEFSKLLPSGGHVVHITDDSGIPSTYTVSMFHQLRCLDILRQDYITEPPQPPSRLSEHCMNYLRQMFWCHPNLRLESMRYPPYIENHAPAGATTQGYDTLCHDWRAVYEEAEKKYDAFELLAR